MQQLGEHGEHPGGHPASMISTSASTTRLYEHLDGDAPTLRGLSPSCLGSSSDAPRKEKSDAPVDPTSSSSGAGEPTRQ
jgi:hypothetical protein